MFGIGAGEFVIILIVGLIVFGPSKLPEIGRAIGKGLKEFRKAQAALSATLNEPLDEPPKKIRNEELGIRNEKVAEEKISTEKKPMTADDVINLTKETSIVKESSHEKISDNNSVDAPVGDARASVAGAASGSNSTDKQSKPSAN